jgi:hypothetical protein
MALKLHADLCPTDLRVANFKKWINPSEWMDGFEQAQNRRTTGTGDWILNESVYQNWRSSVQNPGSSLAARTLSIQGKSPLPSLSKRKYLPTCYSKTWIWKNYSMHHHNRRLERVYP